MLGNKCGGPISNVVIPASPGMTDMGNEARPVFLIDLAACRA